MPGSSWPTTVAEARRLQEQLRDRVVTSGSAKAATRVAGVDVHVRGNTAVAVAALVTLPSLALVETSVAEREVHFPYVPGYLSFRELPAALAALRGLREPADALLVDGHGLAHPRRFGLACHLGVELDLPTVGCAKSRLIGTYDEPETERGSAAPLMDGRERIGTVLRTRSAVAPMFISVGHRLSLPAAVELVERCTGRTRQPVPLRQAHLKARRLASA